MNMDYQAGVRNLGGKPPMVPKLLVSIFEWMEAIVASFVVVMILFSVIFHVITVDGMSMYPTLVNQDKVLVYNQFYTPKFGDIIVVTDATVNHDTIVKRVIGVGGDHVEIDYTDGTVIVNGNRLTENYINEPIEPIPNHEFSVDVPEGRVFVLGDNRNRSDDSRVAEIGLIDESLIMGKVVFRLFPIAQFGTVH